MPLTTDPLSIAENSAGGTAIGTLGGGTAGASIALVDDAGGRVSLSGRTLSTGATPIDREATDALPFTVRQSKAGFGDLVQGFTIVVTNVFEQPPLAALGLSSTTTLAIGTPGSGTISGTTAGSTITATGLPAGLTINGPARTWAWSGSGSAGTTNATLTETLTDSANSPRASVIGVTVAAAGNYLATVASAPLAVYGARRLVAGHAGNLFQLRRASDNATQNFACAAGSDKPDYAAIDLWRGSSDTFVTQVFDQLGVAPALAQATTASQFKFETAQASRFAQGAPFATYANAAPFMTATPLSLNRQNISYLMMGECGTSGLQCGLMSIETSGTNSQAFYHSSNAGRLAVSEGSAVLPSTAAYPRSNPSVIGMTANASERRFFFRETNEAVAAGSAGTATDFRVGLTSAASGGINWKTWGWAIYPALSTGDMTALIASAAVACNCPTTFDRRIVIAGDSIGHGRANSVYYRNAPYYYLPNLNGSPEFINRSVDGSTLATLDTNYASATGAEGVSRFFTSAYGAGKCVLVVQRCSNDISTGSTGSATYGWATSVVSKAKTTGFKVGLATMISRGGSIGGGMDAIKQAERVTYNSAVTGNAAGADFVIDFGADATVLGTETGYGNTTHYSGDQVHPLDAGYARAGPYYASALNAAVP